MKEDQRNTLSEKMDSLEGAMNGDRQWLKSIDELVERLRNAPVVFIPESDIEPCGCDSMGISHNCPEPSAETLASVKKWLDDGIPLDGSRNSEFGWIATANSTHRRFAGRGRG